MVLFYFYFFLMTAATHSRSSKGMSKTSYSDNPLLDLISFSQKKTHLPNAKLADLLNLAALCHDPSEKWVSQAFLNVMGKIGLDDLCVRFQKILSFFFFLPLFLFNPCCLRSSVHLFTLCSCSCCSNTS